MGTARRQDHVSKTQARVPVRLSVFVRPEPASSVRFGASEGRVMSEIAGDDVLHFLQRLPDDGADLIIADPPYGIDKNFGVADAWSSIEEWAVWCEQWLQECVRVL